jgi:hypothetical protein
MPTDTTLKIMLKHTTLKTHLSAVVRAAEELWAVTAAKQMADDTASIIHAGKRSAFW